MTKDEAYLEGFEYAMDIGYVQYQDREEPDSIPIGESFNISESV